MLLKCIVTMLAVKKKIGNFCVGLFITYVHSTKHIHMISPYKWASANSAFHPSGVNKWVVGLFTGRVLGGAIWWMPTRL